MTTVDSWPKTLPMPSAPSWNSITETHLVNRLYKIYYFQRHLEEECSIKDDWEGCLASPVNHGMCIPDNFPSVLHWDCGLWGMTPSTVEFYHFVYQNVYSHLLHSSFVIITLQFLHIVFLLYSKSKNFLFSTPCRSESVNKLKFFSK